MNKCFSTHNLEFCSCWNYNILSEIWCLQFKENASNWYFHQENLEVSNRFVKSDILAYCRWELLIRSSPKAFVFSFHKWWIYTLLYLLSLKATTFCMNMWLGIGIKCESKCYSLQLARPNIISFPQFPFSCLSTESQQA